MALFGSRSDDGVPGEQPDSLPSFLSQSSHYLYSMKPGRVVILLAGRHAGKKAIIVRQHDDGKKVSSLVCLIYGLF